MPFLPEARVRNTFQAALVVCLATMSSKVHCCHGYAPSSSMLTIASATRVSPKFSLQASDGNDENESAQSLSTSCLSRNQFLGCLVVIPWSAAFLNGGSALAFDGGVGGLGKTKPTTE